MNTTIAFTIKDLIIIMACLAGIALLVYLILLLAEVRKTLKTVRTLVEERRVEIDDLLLRAPNIVANVDKVTDVVAKGVDGAYQGAIGIVNKFKGD
ncbi:MAG: hypothetical protein GX978_03215 [Tissierellia bacterium]|jgi:uncharacterized protein YoxC|nr:hypothetical protein [Tissierellia bacterium]